MLNWKVSVILVPAVTDVGYCDTKMTGNWLTGYIVIVPVREPNVNPASTILII